MLAIEQYQACEERLSEMTVDFKTLQNRRKQLIEVTKRLESQRKERLTDVLYHVNKNFESVYKKLSDGGKEICISKILTNLFKADSICGHSQSG